MNDIGKKAHVLKHSHGICVVGAFDKNLYEGYIWTILHPTQINISSLCTSWYNFFDKYINTDGRKNILIIMGVVFLQNGRIESYIIKTFRRHMGIYVMFFPIHIYNIQEYEGCIQGGNKSQKFLSVIKVHHIMMLKYHHNSYHVFMMQ